MRAYRTSIRTKLQLIFGSAVGLLFLLFVLFVYTQVRASFEKLIEAGASETASRYALTIKAKVDDAFTVGRTLAQVLEDRERDKPADRRLGVSKLLAPVLERSPDFLAVWTIWEPGALDGLDARYRSSQYGNEAGRFDQFWYRRSDDTVSSFIQGESALAFFEPYSVTRKANQESIIGPAVRGYGAGATAALATSVIMSTSIFSLSMRLRMKA